MFYNLVLSTICDFMVKQWRTHASVSFTLFLQVAWTQNSLRTRAEESSDGPKLLTTAFKTPLNLQTLYYVGLW